jgi:hypothetical protein
MMKLTKNKKVSVLHYSIDIYNTISQKKNIIPYFLLALHSSRPCSPNAMQLRKESSSVPMDDVSIAELMKKQEETDIHAGRKKVLSRSLRIDHVHIKRRHYSCLSMGIDVHMERRHLRQPCD